MRRADWFFAGGFLLSLLLASCQSATYPRFERDPGCPDMPYCSTRHDIRR